MPVSPGLTAYSNGFETDTSGWCDQPGAYGPCDGVSNGTLDREPNGFSNYALYAPFINSAGGSWHARAAGATNQGVGNPCVGSGSGANASPPCSGPYTDWNAGVGASQFPAGGFTTSLDIYLDTNWAASHPDDSGNGGAGGARFDWDSAMNDSSGGFLQDYAFNAGTSPPGWAGGAGFVVNTSTNAGRGSAFPENTCPGPNTAPNGCRLPVTITSSGWYTFTHRFFDSGGGNLSVEFTIKDSGGTIVTDSQSNTADWTIDTGNAISTVGGPFAGYFANEEILGLPIDNASLKLNNPPVTYSSTVLGDHPVSYWKLNDGTPTAVDSADGNNGTYAGGFAQGAPGPVSGCRATTFNGTTGYVSVPDAMNLHTGDMFSLEAWVKPSKLGVVNGILWKGTNSYQFFLNSLNQLQLYKNNVGTIASGTVAIADTTNWHYVVATKSGSSVHLYLDGADVTGPVTNRTLSDSTSVLKIAAGAGFFHGGMGQVAVYPSALSASQVSSHFSAASNGC